MPLPAALLARLKKRGIASRNNTAETVEEVFAESYDEKDNNTQTEERLAPEEWVHEIVDCPNVSNRYHECTEYCIKRWGLRKFIHIAALSAKKDKMLGKYPLPTGWVEVGDPTTGRCYYWNMDSDKVSWLPPQHPRAKITVSAEKLQATMKSRTEEVFTDKKRKPVSVTIKDKEERSQPNTKKQKRSLDELDPMDPAAYSEVERGGWSIGLKAETKTGVDVTASGPLFQQRPYPSPGDILRAQAAQGK